MNDLVNINLKPLSDVANNLIDKLALGIGWIANHDTSRRIAERTYIEDIKNSDLPPLMRAAFISDAGKIIKEYSNQNNIVNIAIDNLMPSAKPKQINDDWLARFMNKARLVSDEQFQLIWGNILAKECNSPSSIPSSLLYILEQMDKKDAEDFSILCSLSIFTEENGKKHFVPMILSSKLRSYYSSIGISYDVLVNLQSLGLIEITMGLTDHRYSQTIDIEPRVIHYFDEAFELPTDMNEFLCGNVIYTKNGNALCNVINVEKREGFFNNICVPVWKQMSS